MDGKDYHSSATITGVAVGRERNGANMVAALSAIRWRS